MKKSAKLYLKLFWSTFQLSAFVVGGGYVIVPLMQKMFVEKYGWISKEDMLDITVIGQSAPGAIAINTAILIGFKLAGVLGSIVSVLGAILPPVVTVTVVAFFYNAFSSNVIVAGFLKGMQGGIAAVILDVVYTMVKPYVRKRDVFSLILMAGVFVLTVFTGINVIFIVLGGIAIGIILYLLQRHPKLKSFINNKIFISNEVNSEDKSLENILLKSASEENNNDKNNLESGSSDAETGPPLSGSSDAETGTPSSGSSNLKRDTLPSDSFETEKDDEAGEGGTEIVKKINGSKDKKGGKRKISTDNSGGEK